MEQVLQPGLAGIPAAESAISWIDGQAGILKYRGYRIEDLCEDAGFEEICWLLLHGELPTQKQLGVFESKLRAERAAVPSELITLMSGLPQTTHPMDALQAGLALLGAWYPKPDFKNQEESEHAICILLAATPVLVAAFDRGRRGLPFHAASEDASIASGFLEMLNGEAPTELAARTLDVALVLHAEHTMNASTFAARVVASTEADPFTVCSSAVGALTGPLHGGANERVLNQLEAIGTIDNVMGWFEDRVTKKAKIMGFGHRVYKTKDPRATALEGLVRRLFSEQGSTPLYDMAAKLEDAVVDRLGGKGIHPNVDFFSGLVYQKLGIATDLFTPVFAIARVSGWMAHWYEQMQDNKIFRPTQIYTGVDDRKFVPIADRG